MPSDKKKTKQVKSAFDLTEEKDSIPAEEAAPTSRKRSSTHDYLEDSENDDERTMSTEVNGEAEMSSLLKSFGADISKTLSAKRKKLATFTSASLKTSNRKYEEILVMQQKEREKMNDEFSKQIGSVFLQWETDVQKSKDAEEKLENIVKQLQKTIQQQRVVHSQRLKSLKTLHDQYMKGSQDLNKAHREQQSNINTELRKELSTLQKKMMDEARQEEMSNVRKSLQSMLSQV